MHIQISNQHHWGSGQGSRSLKTEIYSRAAGETRGERILNIIFLLQKPDIEGIDREKWMKQQSKDRTLRYQKLRKNVSKEKKIFRKKL